MVKSTYVAVVVVLVEVVEGEREHVQYGRAMRSVTTATNYELSKFWNFETL